MQRLYIHGDQHEADRDMFYCACCDLFTPAAHFNAHEPERHARALERTLRLLESYERRPGKFARPHSPPGLRFAPPTPPVPSPAHSRSAALNRWGYRWGEGGGRRT